MVKEPLVGPFDKALQTGQRIKAASTTMTTARSWFRACDSMPGPLANQPHQNPGHMMHQADKQQGQGALGVCWGCWAAALAGLSCHSVCCLRGVANRGVPLHHRCYLSHPNASDGSGAGRGSDQDCSSSYLLPSTTTDFPILLPSSSSVSSVMRLLLPDALR